ncbi:MSEP-CTERM domain containing protein [Orpheovirus IHUMI-LCC2]|uniref:MSEP-CTERM domain containing protein n=1 Tax=Orpheovirus IHUMI-LCC2 TaxID=2023057 RepID=A0A2I2L5T8_9VIRU|nr:MSEP-CTERM domain containing protein [Orpheovirus IHUMI-LCC2]SNW62819.1 MSEP-CTERM domain containing protein [Orpheovirus IHUMI-LCC2]
MSTISTVSLIIGVAGLSLFIGVGAYIIYLLTQSLPIPTWAWILLIIGFLFALIGFILYFVYRNRVIVPVVNPTPVIAQQPLVTTAPQAFTLPTPSPQVINTVAPLCVKWTPSVESCGAPVPISSCAGGTCPFTAGASTAVPVNAVATTVNPFTGGIGTVTSVPNAAYATVPAGAIVTNTAPRVF